MSRSPYASTSLRVTAALVLGLSLTTGAMVGCSNGDSTKATQQSSVAVKDVQLDLKTATLAVGQTQPLTATVVPSNATNKGVTWSTDTPSVATVSNGTVTAVGAGQATITVTTHDGARKANCVVQVTAPAVVTVSSIQPPNPTLPTNATQQFTATVSGSTDTAITWTVQSGQGTISDAGLYTAPAAAGTAVIRATSHADATKYQETNVTINAPVVRTVATPIFSAPSGTYNLASLSVSISSPTPGATIHYTTDGNAPTAASPVYSGPINITQLTTLRAMATLAGWKDSEEVSANFKIDPAPAKPWVTAYSPSWLYGRKFMNPEEIDYTQMTHFVFCKVDLTESGEITGAPYLQRGLSNSVDTPYTTKDGRSYKSIEEAYVGEAHRKGAKALLVLGGGGAGAPILAANQNDASRANAVRNLINHLELADYDGIDVDWEDNFPADHAVFVRFFQDLRQEADKRARYRPPNNPLILTWATYVLANADIAPWFEAAPNGENLPKIARAQAVAPYVDQINLMSYGEGNLFGYALRSWGYNNLRNTTEVQAAHAMDLEYAMNRYVKAGVPKAKLGFGFGLYTTQFKSFAPWAPNTAYTAGTRVVAGYAVYRANTAGTSSATGKPVGFGATIQDGGNPALTWQYIGHMGAEQIPADIASSVQDTDDYGGTLPTSWVGKIHNMVKEGTTYYEAETGNAYTIFQDDPQMRGYITYENERSIAAKCQWLRANGFGGVIVWTIGYGNVGSGNTADYNNPYMAAIATSLFGPMPVDIRLTQFKGTVVPGGTHTYTVAELTGTDNKAVTWSVVEAGGGTVDAATGVYTAPEVPGIYHVRATSQADPRIYADIAVKVTL